MCPIHVQYFLAYDDEFEFVPSLNTNFTVIPLVNNPLLVVNIR